MKKFWKVLAIIVAVLVWLAAIVAIIVGVLVKEKLSIQVGTIVGLISTPLMSQLLGIIPKYIHFKKVKGETEKVVNAKTQFETQIEKLQQELKTINENEKKENHTRFF